MKRGVVCRHLLGALVIGRCALALAQSTPVECLQSVPIVPSGTAAEIEQACAMNRKILANCRSLTAANLANESFAQQILAQLVQAECDRAAAEWDAAHGKAAASCAKAWEDFQRKMQSFAAESARYEQDVAAYTAATGHPPPSPSSGNSGLSFSVTWCIGDCPKIPVRPQPPASPTCEIQTPPNCDVKAVTEKLKPQALARARESLDSMMKIRLDALENDCQEAKLVAQDADRRKKADEAVQKTIDASEQVMKRKEEAFKDDQAARQRLATTASDGGSRVARVAKELGSLEPPRTGAALAVDPQAHRPGRIHYGVRRQDKAAASSTRSDPPDLARFVAGNDARRQRCTQNRQLVSDMKRTEDELTKVMDRLGKTSAPSELAEASKRLGALRAARERLEAATADCDK